MITAIVLTAFMAINTIIMTHLFDKMEKSEKRVRELGNALTFVVQAIQQLAIADIKIESILDDEREVMQ